MILLYDMEAKNFPSAFKSFNAGLAVDLGDVFYKNEFLQ